MQRVAAISSCTDPTNSKCSTALAATESLAFSCMPHHNGLDGFGRRVRFPSIVSQNDPKY
jgi:hypothetical protein